MDNFSEFNSKEIENDIENNNTKRDSDFGIDIDKIADMSLDSSNIDVDSDDFEKNTETTFSSVMNDVDIDKIADMSLDSNSIDVNSNDLVKNIDLTTNDIDIDKIADMSLDSNKLFKDDNGIVYRDGDNLIPNNCYEINGYNYETDEYGRIDGVKGELKLKADRPRREIVDSMDVIGKGYQLHTDDRGHLIADRFDGSNGMENIIPQDAKLNQGEYKLFENQLAKEVENGKKVMIRIDPYYIGESRRPEKLFVTYSIDGNKYMKVFDNKKGD